MIYSLKNGSKCKIDKVLDVSTRQYVLLGDGMVGKSTIFNSLAPDFFPSTMFQSIFHAFQFTYDNIDFVEIPMEKILDVFGFTDELETEYTPKKAELYNLIIEDPDYKEKIKTIMMRYVECEYFFRMKPWLHFHQNVKDIYQEDLMRTYVRTTGFASKSLERFNIPFTLTDTGGQRNERKKWRHVMQYFNQPIFVASLIEFDQTLYEASDENRMVESLRTFKEVINNSIYQNHDIILVLSKVDLFPKIYENYFEKFVEVLSLENEGLNPKDYLSAIECIKKAFLSHNKNSERKIIIHTCNLLDPRDVEKIFNISLPLSNHAKDLLKREKDYLREFWNIKEDSLMEKALNFHDKDVYFNFHKHSQVE